MLTFELLSPGKHLPDGYWTSLAPGVRRVEIEIGPGDGRFLAQSALADPTTLFVGFEIRAGLAHELEAGADLPANVRVFHVDGRWIVCHLLADRSVDAFHVYFPDPWWKKRHHKRRLFTDEFVRSLYRCLKAGGRVYIITDVQPLFTEIEDKMRAVGFAEIAWTRNPDERAQSSYERKYRRQGRHLEQACFVKEG